MNPESSSRPRARLSAGRSVSPLPRPGIAAARDLRLEPGAPVSLPPRDEIRLLPDSPGELFPMRVERAQLVEMTPEAFRTPAVELIPVSFPGQPLFRSFEPLSPSPGSGVGIHFESPAARPEPPPLVAFAAGYRARSVDALRPLLAPPALPAAGEEPWPFGPRADQIETASALLEREAALLTASPGAGKTTAVCLALLAAFQAGQAKRALVVAPEGRIRHWAGALARWSPGLAVAQLTRSSAPPGIEQTPHVFLTDLRALGAHVDRGSPPLDGESFDIVVLDWAHALRRRSRVSWGALASVSGRRRWATSGGRPRDLDEARAILGWLRPEAVESFEGGEIEQLLEIFEPDLLQRSRAALDPVRPRHTRTVLWIDPRSEELAAYQEVLAEERYRLRQLGSSATRTHIRAAVEQLAHASGFPGGALDSAKRRCLMDLLEEITAADEKVVVFSTLGGRTLDRLQPALQDFGAARLRAEDPEEERRKTVSSFRSDPALRVLLADIEARFGGERVSEVGHIVHFDPGWNSALRRRAEARLHPGVGAAPAVSIFEFWVTGTVDERIYRWLSQRKIQPEDIALETRPVDLEAAWSVEDWLGDILRVSGPERREPSAPRGGSGVLPGTSLFRDRLARLPPDRLLEGVRRFMEALGFTETQELIPPSESGGELIAQRTIEGLVERALVRCVRASRTLGVGEARRTLEALELQPAFLGAYLLTTTDFTSSARELAEESQGRLVLVPGDELYRHLHILGWM